jgi:two-component system OmpR family sensor kinase
MSLRWRLTLWSSLVLAIVVAVLGTLAVITVRSFLLQRVDTNLNQQTTASLLPFVTQRQEQNLQSISININNPVDAVFYTIWDNKGQVYQYDRQMPVKPDDITLALQGQTVIDTIPLGDGSTVRVMFKPIYNHIGQVVGVLQASTPLGYIDQVTSEITLLLGLAAVALLLIGAVGSYLLTGRAFRAVAHVNSKVNQIVMSQDLTQRLPESGSADEIGRLVTTFNRLLARLESAFETQRRFVADSSHELRTPLTVIKSNLHLLHQPNSASERSELLSVTEGEVARLNRMVDDLLYMAQMQAGHDLKPVLRPVELDSLLLDMFARARPLAMLKHQKLSLIHEDIAASMGDRDQLQHLLLNLLDNAIKYTGEEGIVTLGLWSDDGWARIEVSDNGPGIAEEDLPLIFDRFFRTADARQNQRNGSGLGLAIVKSIAESHNGKVEVYSRLGEGTTFRLWLRLMDAPQSPSLDYEDDQPAALMPPPSPAATSELQPSPSYATAASPAEILE